MADRRHEGKGEAWALVAHQQDVGEVLGRRGGCVAAEA
jgi:predicted RNA-binding protein YlqC (UPF0109 family)